ncbi:MAG: vitamin K epoxide reductase family protein [Desulfobacter sp.]
MTKRPDPDKKQVPVIYFIILILLLITGIGLSSYLSYSHYKVYTDIYYASFCAVSKAVNCDTVSQSSYSIFLNLPVPLWGMLGYAFMSVLFVIFKNFKKKRINGLYLFIGLSLVFCIVSLWLGIISAFKIHSYCFMCIGLYAVNFSFLYLFWLLKRRVDPKNFKQGILVEIQLLISCRKAMALSAGGFACIVLIVYFIVPRYWEMRPDMSGGTNLHTGVTKDGSPWIGAEEPQLTIIEYADYQCFQCRKMHFFLRHLIAEHSDKIRLVHKHFPMDKAVNPIVAQNLNPGSGILSRIAIHAADVGKFWEVNDYLYHYNIDKKAIFLKQIARDTGLDLDTLKNAINTQPVNDKLLRDIVSGLQLKITGTPSYLIDNEVYTATIPVAILNRLGK